jgi:hypothetical protein
LYMRTANALLFSSVMLSDFILFILYPVLFFYKEGGLRVRSEE